MANFLEGESLLLQLTHKLTTVFSEPAIPIERGRFFPAVGMYGTRASVCANFGAQAFKYVVRKEIEPAKPWALQALQPALVPFNSILRLNPRFLLL